MAADSFNTDYFNDSWMAYLLLGTSLPAGFPSSSGTVYLGLSSTVPSRDKSSNGGSFWNVTEPNSNNYARVPLLCTSNNFNRLASGIYGVNNGGSNPIQWNIPSGSWSSYPLLSFCFFDAATPRTGNLLHVDTKTIQPLWVDTTRGQLRLLNNHLRVGIRCYGTRRSIISEWLADQFMGYNYGSGSLPSSLSSSGVWILLLQRFAIPSDTGTTLNAAGQFPNPYAAAFTNWNKLKPGIYANTYSLLGYTTYLGGYPGFACCDAKTSGNMLFAGVLNAPCIFNSLAPLFTLYENNVQIGLGR